MELTRRRFLGVASAATGTALVMPRFGFTKAGASERPGDVIVLVFLRGGMDGLSLVAPAEMATYKSIRPTIRIKTPDEFDSPDGVAGMPLVSGGNVGDFDRSGQFFMHPRADALHQTAWADGNMAIVHAAGMPASESDTRSHFSSTRNWEAGSAAPSVNDGFLNRFLTQIDAESLIPGVSRGTQLSMSLAGLAPSVSMTSIDGFGVSGFGDNANASAGLAHLYPGAGSEDWDASGAGTLSAIGTVQGTDWSLPALSPANGASYSNSALGKDLSEVSSLIKADIGMRVATVSAGGWDTHGDMGAPEDSGSYFGGRVEDLSNNLAAFYTDLGSGMDNVTVVTVSEFGRTINENSNGGTDHGRATAMLVMGNNVAGGVRGEFVDDLTDGPEGDLEVLNDYRTVLSEILIERGGAGNVDDVFPTWAGQPHVGVCS